jgi:hypothetical protein
MTRLPGKARALQRVFHLRVQTRYIPHSPRQRAQLAHLWSHWGDESLCEGCGQPIEADDIEYELQFGPDARCVRFHRQCWENGRGVRLKSERARSGSPRQTLERRSYVCTQHPDGRIVCGEHRDAGSAGSALETFLDTARRLGYRIHTRTSRAGADARYVARQGRAWVIFWISQTDESTQAPRRTRECSRGPTRS